MQAVKKPTVFLLDVDGVMTTGHFLYTEQGKALKIFGADDNDALSLLSAYVEIRFISGDKRGFEISKKRIVDDMGFPLDLVSTILRAEWIESRYQLDEVIYMGDGIFDHYVMKKVAYSVAPANADPNAKKAAQFVTQRKGGDRAVAEACLHIMERFFEPFNPNELPNTEKQPSREWTV